MTQELKETILKAQAEIDNEIQEGKLSWEEGYCRLTDLLNEALN